MHPNGNPHRSWLYAVSWGFGLLPPRYSEFLQKGRKACILNALDRYNTRALRRTKSREDNSEGDTVVASNDDQSLTSAANRGGNEELLPEPEGGAHVSTTPEPEKDHRGVTLPTRHRAGGIITPQ